MGDFLWQHAGLLEFILGTEFVILVAAGFFYQVAKIIAKTDRHDPLVRFYRIFWVTFFSSVSSIKELDAREAEKAARAAGVLGVGDLSNEQLNRLDAPDLGNISGGAPEAVPTFLDPGEETADEPPASAVRVVGRTGPANESRLREVMGKGGPSREHKFMERNKAAREQPPAAIPPLEDDTPISVSREREATAPQAFRPANQTAATAAFDVCISPFQPKPRITGRRQGEVLIDVTCAPEDGQANGTIIELMALQLQVRPYQIVLIRGHYKIRKTLQVPAWIPPAWRHGSNGSDAPINRTSGRPEAKRAAPCGPRRSPTSRC